MGIRRWVFGTIALSVVGFAACSDGRSPIEPDGPNFANCVKKPDHPACLPGGEEPPTQECNLDFVLTLHDTRSGGGPTGVRGSAWGGPEDPNEYEDGMDRVGVFTGSGSGFRFDTNGSQRLEANNDRRRVYLAFEDQDPGGELSNQDRGIDLRFSKGDGGLNLCAIPVGGHGSVPVGLNSEAAKLLWGGVHQASGHECGAPEVIVHRDLQNEWHLESGDTACLYVDNVYQGPVSMSVRFTIDSKTEAPLPPSGT